MDALNKILSKSIKLAQYDGMMDELGMPDGVSISGPFYHGTCIDPNEGPFDELYSGMSEFDAIWVSEDEWVSEMFANDDCGENSYMVVYRLDNEINNAIPLSKEIVDGLTTIFDEPDIREIIPNLEMAGYDGWTTMGSIGEHLYTDIAIFKNSVSISDMKVKIGDEWTEYFPPEEFGSIMKGKMKSDHLERFTRVMHV